MRNLSYNKRKIVFEKFNSKMKDRNLWEMKIYHCRLIIELLDF